MGRSKHKGNSGRFSGIPYRVIDSDAYKSLGGNAVKLLTLLGRQYNSHNNGNLLITQSKIGDWITKNTMYSAKEELHKKGFIVINAFGGKSFGEGRKLPSLYGLTYYPMHELTDVNNEIRYTHYRPSPIPLDYWKNGDNPDFRSREEIKSQFKKDVKKIKKTNHHY